MSYIEILLLRHLTRRPAHGYELRKRVERTTGVRLNNNSLYPALRRFEEAGAVTRSEEPQDGRPPRLVYALTPLGKQFMQPVRGLVTWLQTHWSTIRAAREKFDGQSQSRKAS